jgi:hypothetical protein
MKPGAYGAIMFANWIRHPRIKAKPEDNYIIYANQLGCPGMGWYYCDETITRNLITIAGFVNYEDSLPDFRDTMAVFKKKP